MKPSKYPVGARWRAVDSKGNIAEIWLDHRHDSGAEFWHWSFCHADGSGRKGDWGPTLRCCRDEVSFWVCSKVRFQRCE